jgi:hypothetical protein
MALKALKRYKLKLNSADKIEELLQELYNESCKNIETIQNEMNKLSNSINLNDEIVDSKTKYAKAMNDFITNKDKAIGRKLEIAKLMTEVLKFNGNVSKTFAESEAVGDWSEFMNMVNKDGTLQSDNKEEETLEYHLN